MKEYKHTKWKDTDPVIHVFKTTPKFHEKSHTHDFIEIVYVLSGVSEQVIDGVAYNTRRGDLLFIGYGATHEFTPVEDFTYINICFYPETMGNIVTPQNSFSLLSLAVFNQVSRNGQGGKVSFTGAERDEIEYILLQMLKEQEGQQKERNLVVESYMNILIAKILRQTEESLVEEPAKWLEIVDYIDKNPSADLSLSTLAKQCFHNPSYFSRIFKEQMGVTLTKYVTKKRIERAITLLTETDLAIEKIASETGFSSKSALYKAFKENGNIAPSDYRK